MLTCIVMSIHQGKSKQSQSNLKENILKKENRSIITFHYPDMKVIKKGAE